MYRTRGRLVFRSVLLACVLLFVAAAVLHWSALVSAAAVLVSMANVVMFQRAQQRS